jgi:dihydrofolate synthase/folylpolyglutamate synthase
MVENRTSFEEIFHNNEFKHLNLSLSRISKALKEINFNERDLGKIIHIAGTNGKGSTAKFLADMLLNEQYNVALYTSPHIDRINERIAYNGECISDDEMDGLFSKLKSVVVNNKLSYFEALTLLAFKYFSNKQPQYSIIETGLGGRFDATNVLETKLPVITSISFDHNDILGKNIFRIADEKLAIVKDNRYIFVGYNKSFMKQYIETQLSGRSIFFTDEPDDDGLHYPYPYCYNYMLAKEMFYYLIGEKYDGDLPFLPPCRFEIYDRFIIDGTHTVNGLIELFKNFTEKPDVIFSLTKERDVFTFINILKKYGNRIILTEIPENDRSIKISSVDIEDVKLIKDPISAIKYMINNHDSKPVLITGSFYLCAYLRRYLTKIL